MTKKKRVFAIVVCSFLLVFMTAFIFGNSLLVAEQSAANSGRFVPLIQKALSSIGFDAKADDVSFFIRKTAHFLEYFILGTLASLIITLSTEKRIYLTVSPLYCFLVAVVDEFVMQGMTEGRSPEWRDVLIDVCGAVLSAVLIITILKIIKRNRR